MPQIIAIATCLCLLGALAAGIAVSAAAKKFFAQLVNQHPELVDSFPLPGRFTRYGPIRPSYMDYLKAKRYLQLPEPELQRAGARIQLLLNLYAVLFVGFVLSALWWRYQNRA
jgi:hypothetical protein